MHFCFEIGGYAGSVQSGNIFNQIFGFKWLFLKRNSRLDDQLFITQERKDARYRKLRIDCIFLVIKKGKFLRDFLFHVFFFKGLAPEY